MNMLVLYLPDETGRPVPARSYVDWARWFQQNDPVLRRHTIGRFVVTTRWAGADTRANVDAPRVWETTVHEVPNWWRWMVRRLLGRPAPYRQTWASSMEAAFRNHYNARSWAQARRWWL